MVRAAKGSSEGPRLGMTKDLVSMACWGGGDFNMGIFPKRRPEKRGRARHAKYSRKCPKLRTWCPQELELGE